MVLSGAGAGGVGIIQYCIENPIIHPRVPARQWEIMTECYLRLGHKVRELKVCANGRNNSQHCWASNVGTSCIRLHGATVNVWPVSNFAQLNNSQKHATTCNRVCKQTQHVTSNNVGSSFVGQQRWVRLHRALNNNDGDGYENLT